MHLRIVASACLVLLLATSLRADTFSTLQGESFEGEVKDLYGDTVLFGVKQSTRSLNLNALNDASLLKVAAFLAARPAEAPRWSQSTSKVAKSVARKLQVLHNGKWASFDPGDRPEPEFYVLYYGAYWCGPCRRFSPSLVESYHRLKAMGPDRFEVIFLSSDNDDLGQITYAKEVNMPWPVLKFSQARRVPVFEQWRADGIPSVVVITRDGDALFHSYRDKEYLGPDDPLTRFTQLLQSTSGPQVNAPRPGRHRLAIAQHLQVAMDGDREPKPYLVGLDRNRLRTLPPQQLRVQLTISASGQVDDVEFLTQLDAVHKDQLRRNIEKWLFLPAVAKGQPQPSVIVFPIDISAT